MAVSNQDPACFLPRVLFDRQGSLILGSFVFRRRMSSHGFVGLPVLFLLPISIVFRRCSSSYALRGLEVSMDCRSAVYVCREMVWER